MSKEKLEINNGNQPIRTAFIGICVFNMGVFLYFALRHLYMCNTGGRTQCMFSDYFIELGGLLLFTVFLLVGIYRYNWIAVKKDDSSKNWIYIPLLLIMMVILYLFHIYFKVSSEQRILLKRSILGGLNCY